MPRKLLLALCIALAQSLIGCGGGSATPPVDPAVSPIPSSGPPVILASPSSLSAPSGVSASLGVVAGGSPPLRYQWYRNGIAIDGAHSGTYTTPPLAAADDGAIFEVVVKNDEGSVRSGRAMLRVTAGDDALGNLQRLANIVVAVIDGTRVTQNLFLSTLAAARVPEGPCVLGGSFDSTVDGRPASSGTALPLPRGTLEVAYTGCRMGPRLFHDGQVALMYDFRDSDPERLRYSADLRSLTILVSEADEFSTWNVTLTGGIDAELTIKGRSGSAADASTVTEFLYTPAPGTTVLSHATGRVARYLSGSYVALDVGNSTYLYPTTVAFLRLTFEIEGSVYVVNSPSRSTVEVERDGKLLGRFELSPYDSTDAIARGEAFVPVDPLL